MRHLTFLAPGKFEWRDVAAPTLAADTDAIVAPIAVARCDLDLYIALGVVKYPGSFAFGHETVARVVDAGPKAGVAPGDVVVVPFQLSCGRCATCLRGWTNACEAYPFGAAYGLKPTSKTEFGGALSDLMRVPYADHMLVRLPEGLDPVAAASVSDNVSDGWRGVAGPLKERPGATVLVIGGLAQSVSIYAAGAAVALGEGRTLYARDARSIWMTTRDGAPPPPPWAPRLRRWPGVNRWSLSKSSSKVREIPTRSRSPSSPARRMGS
jgi:alcohol dehydrogenase